MKNKYLVTPSQFQPLYWIVEAKTPGEAIATDYNIAIHDHATNKEESRQLLIKKGFNIIESTPYKEIFKLIK